MIWTSHLLTYMFTIWKILNQLNGILSWQPKVKSCVFIYNLLHNISLICKWGKIEKCIYCMILGPWAFIVDQTFFGYWIHSILFLMNSNSIWSNPNCFSERFSAWIRVYNLQVVNIYLDSNAKFIMIFSCLSISTIYIYIRHSKILKFLRYFYYLKNRFIFNPAIWYK